RLSAAARYRLRGGDHLRPGQLARRPDLHGARPAGALRMTNLSSGVEAASRSAGADQSVTLVEPGAAGHATTRRRFKWNGTVVVGVVLLLLVVLAALLAPVLAPHDPN